MMILNPLLFASVAERESWYEMQIQQEAHKLVERLKREFPGVGFTFVLTNQPEVAQLVSENMHILQSRDEVKILSQKQDEVLENKLQKVRRLEQDMLRLNEEKQEVLGSVRKMYQELADLQGQHDQLVSEMVRARKDSQQLYEERDRVSLEIVHFRKVMMRLQEALDDVPDFMVPQRVAGDRLLAPTP